VLRQLPRVASGRHNPLDQRREVDDASMQGNLACRHAIHIKKIVHEPSQVLHLPRGGGHRTGHRHISPDRLLQDPHRTGDGAERIA
jgi:hypothetical protein